MELRRYASVITTVIDSPVLSYADCPSGATCNTASNPNFCNSISIDSFSDPAGGSIPWVFHASPPNDPVTGCGGFGCTGGFFHVNQSACRFGGTPNLAEPSYVLPAGAKRFLGRVRYEVSSGWVGSFGISYEVLNDPCENDNLTRVLDDNGNCVSADFLCGVVAAVDCPYSFGPITINSGGLPSMSSLNDYELVASTGQSGGVGIVVSDGNDYEASDGFWHAAADRGCGPCLLFADFVNQATPSPYGPGANCIVDGAEITKVLDGYAAGDLACTNPLLVDTELSYLDACPTACSSSADCPSEAGYPGVCTVLGTCCALVEAADLSRTLDAYGYNFACPAKCVPGACAFNTDADPAFECCKDRDYFPNGMSRTACSAQGGTYLGDDVLCSSASLPYCP